MTDLIVFGSFVGGVWALSLLSLKVIRDSEYAEKRLRDAAALAIVALSFIAGGAASAVYGWNFLFADDPNADQKTGSPMGAGLAVGLFLVPFIAMGIAILFSKKSETTEMQKLRSDVEKLQSEVRTLQTDQVTTADDAEAARIS